MAEKHFILQIILIKLYAGNHYLKLLMLFWFRL
jgi:hypothetical protein